MKATEANAFSQLARDPKINDMLSELLTQLREVKKSQGVVAFAKARQQMISALTKLENENTSTTQK